MTAYEECRLKAIVMKTFSYIWGIYSLFLRKKERSKLFIFKQCLPERVGYKLKKYRKSLILIPWECFGKVIYALHKNPNLGYVFKILLEREENWPIGRGNLIKAKNTKRETNLHKKSRKKTSQVFQALATCRHSAVAQAHDRAVHTHAWFVTVLSTMLCSSAWLQLSWVLGTASFLYFPSSSCSLDCHTEQGGELRRRSQWSV